jgi:archaellum component FlaC
LIAFLAVLRKAADQGEASARFNLGHTCDLIASPSWYTFSNILGAAMTSEERFERIERTLERIAEKVDRIAEGHIELEAGQLSMQRMHARLEDSQLNIERAHTRLENSLAAFVDGSRERIVRLEEGHLKLMEGYTRLAEALTAFSTDTKERIDKLTDLVDVLIKRDLER